MTAPSTTPYTQKLYSIYIYCCVGQISSYQKVVDQIMHACNQCGRTSIFIGVIMEDHNNCSCGVTIHESIFLIYGLIGKLHHNHIKKKIIEKSHHRSLKERKYGFSAIK